MVGVSTKGVYAVAAIYALSRVTEAKLMQIRDIAAVTQISHGYLEQILATLKKASLVVSIRGVNGGYKLARDAKEISLLEVIECVEGKLFEPHEKAGASVILDAYWLDVQEKVRETMNINLSDLDASYQVYFYEI